MLNEMLCFSGCPFKAPAFTAVTFVSFIVLRLVSGTHSVHPLLRAHAEEKNAPPGLVLHFVDILQSKLVKRGERTE